jgi:putative hydrolase of the HAD superfamily
MRSWPACGRNSHLGTLEAVGYDAVLLDLYDTLVWSDWPAWRQRIADRAGVEPARVGEAYDITRSARSVGRYPDPDAELEAVLEAAGADPDTGMVADIRAMERNAFGGTAHIYPDALPVVRKLRDRGVRTALVSNCSYNTRPFVDHLELEGEFDAVILSFEAGTMKPEPEIYNLALEMLGGIDPGRAVFVDDQVRYCDGAAALGIDTRLIVRPNEPLEGSAANTNGHPVIEDLTALL